MSQSLLGILAVLALGMVTTSARAADDKDRQERYDTCAKECAKCMRECASCAHHCATMLAEGKKDHIHTLGTCSNCAEFCAMAAKIASCQGPMANLACDACAKACDECAAACDRCCEKSPDEHMKRCAKECRDCAKACREMIQRVDRAAK